MQQDDLGEPDLKIAGFRLWVHRRQFAKSEDFYDGNWLQVTADCSASDASVRVRGAILMTTDIAGFGDNCALMHRGEIQSAVLAPCEPELKVSLQADGPLGSIRALVDITPDHQAQQHRFAFEADQSYLPGIVRQCSAIVQKYPVRGRRD